MSVSYAPTKLSVPPGFEHLLEGLTREVLREQPPNIISFAAQYFRRKLNERPGTHEDFRKSADSVTQAQKSNAVSNTELAPEPHGQDTAKAVPRNEQTQGIDLNDAEAHKAATLIQTKFREHLAQRQLSNEPPTVETRVQDSGTAAEAQTQDDDRLATVSGAGVAAGETMQEGEHGESERGGSSKEPGSQEGRAEDDEGSSTHGKSIPEGSEGEDSVREGNAHEESTSEGKKSVQEKNVHLDDEPLSADGHEGSTAEGEVLDDTGGDDQGDEDTETNQSMTEEDQD